MTEATTTTVTAPETVPAANIKHKSPGLLNQAQARALTKAEQISLAAQHPDHASALDGREISKDFITQLLSDVDTAPIRPRAPWPAPPHGSMPWRMPPRLLTA